MGRASYAAVVVFTAALLLLPQAASGVPATDDTPPVISYSIDGIAGTNDWFRGSTHGNNITLHWTVSDPESQILSSTGCDPAIQIPGPDTGTTRTCTATSDGGTTSITTRVLKIDANPPTVTATPSRQPNGAGWFNAPLSISWPGSDATSGLASCTSTLNYSGPQTSGTTETGSCTDNAGNSSSDSFLVKYDTVSPTTTATPSRPPNGAGWFRAPFTVSWIGSDAGGSGIASCRNDLNYAGPDTNGLSVSGTCTDNAGNSSSAPFMVRYDTQAPTTVASASRPPNAAGWYRAPVSVSWSGSDAGGSGVASCRSQLDYSGPDTSGTNVTGGCTDNAGNSSSDGVLVKYDATPPTTHATPTPAPNGNGWFNAPLSIRWNGTDATSGIDTCTAQLAYNGPDTRGTTESGSCSDLAGNSSSDFYVVKYDATAPGATVAPGRPPDHSGWYNHALGITWSGADPTSGIASCTSLTYSGPDVANGNVGGNCTDNAGNVTNRNLVLSYDATAPTTTVAPLRSADHNGWYNHALGITWNGTDATSGIGSCSQPITYSNPDSGSASVTGACSDNAGNTTSRTLSFRYDDAAPTTVATPSRAANGAGWFNSPLSIRWNGTDATSGIDTCTAQLAYNGPDTRGTTESGSCSDLAGNSSSDSYVVKYDATAPGVSIDPGRSPDHGGWYNHPLGITWVGSDPTSGISSCTSTTYDGPDTANVNLPGRCTDIAGNATASSFALEYDATGPTVTVTAARNPDHDGWYNHPVVISWSGTDATSGMDSCDSPVSYSGPDDGNASSRGGCSDHAGNRASPPTLSFKYDATAPATSVAPARGPDMNGWYNHPVAVGWRGIDRASGVASCTSLVYSGPDAGSDSRLGTCTDKAGNMSAPVTWVVHYDSTAPGAIAASPDRAPDHGGWYNHAVGIHWSGSDGLAGIASCSSLTYAGPGTAGAPLSGRCVDLAGNASRPVPFALSYDSTPPTLDALSLEGLDGLVRLRWKVAGADQLRLARSPGTKRGSSSEIYAGDGSTFADRRVENYVRYRYTLTAEDLAGNTVRRTASVMPLPVLYAPRADSHLRVHARPRFAWKPAKRARYYNVQLWVDGRKVGSWWPARARLRLSARWSHDGKTQRLERGTYTWYVWPGRGPRKLGRYGALLGKSSFVVG